MRQPRRFKTKIMADYNNNSRLRCFAEALAALEVVRRHDKLRMTELNSHKFELTSKLAIVQNERDESIAEMDRLNIIIQEGDRPNRLEEGAIGAALIKKYCSYRTYLKKVPRVFFENK